MHFVWQNRIFVHGCDPSLALHGFVGGLGNYSAPHGSLDYLQMHVD